MVHLLKSNIGSSIYSIPFAFQESGLWFGFFGLAFMALISTHCMQMLVSWRNSIKLNWLNLICLSVLSSTSSVYELLI